MKVITPSFQDLADVNNLQINAPDEGELNDHATPAASPNPRRFYGWINACLAGLVLLISMGLIFSFQLFVPILCEEFGWSRAMVGGAATLSMLMLGLSSPASGGITAKYGPRVAMILGLNLYSIGLLVLSVQTQPWQLYTGLALMGAGCGIGAMVPAMTIASNWFVKKRSLALSIINSSVSIGGFVMLPITTALVSGLGWRGTLLGLSGGVLSFTVIVPGMLIRNRPEDLDQSQDGILDSSTGIEDLKELHGIYETTVDFTLKEAIKTWSFWVLILVYGAVQYIFSMLTTHQIAFLETLGIRGMLAAAAAGLQSGMGVVGALGIGLLGVRMDMRGLIIACVAIVSLGMILLLMAKSVPMVFVYNIVIGLGIGAFTTSIFTIYASYFGRTNFPQILGFTMPFWMLLGSSGAAITGALFDATGSYTSPFRVATAAVVLGFVLICSARPPRHPSLT